MYNQYKRLRKEALRRGVQPDGDVNNAVDRASRLDRIMDRYQQNIHKAYMKPIERLQEQGNYQSANRKLDRLASQGYGRGNMPLSRKAYMSGNAG